MVCALAAGLGGLVAAAPAAAAGAPAPPDSLRAAFESAVRAGDLPALVRFIRQRPHLSRDVARRSLTAFVEGRSPTDLDFARRVAACHADALGDSFFVRVVERVTAMGPAELALDRRARDAYRLGASEFAEFHAQQAMAAYHDCIRASRAAGDPFVEAEAWSGLGNAAYSLAQYDDADTLYLRAVALAERHGDRALRMHVQRNLGLVRHARGEYASADTMLRAALEAAIEFRDDALVARTLNDLGNVAQARADFEAAEANYRKALDEVKRLGMARVEAQILGNIAVVRHQQGASEEAFLLYSQALAGATAQGDKRQEAATLANIGYLLEDRGDHSGALASLARALSLEEEMGEGRRLSGILSGMGNAYRGIGDYDRAAEVHRRALGVARSAGNALGEGVALSQLAGDLFESGRLDSALVCIRASRAVCDRIGSRHGRVVARIDEGRILLAMGRAEEAQPRLDEALEMARSSGFLGLEAWVHLGLGMCAIARGAAADARAELESAEDLARATMQGSLEAECHRRLAAALAAASQWDEARDEYRQAIACLEEERGRAGGSDARTLFFESRRRVYEDALFFLADQAEAAGVSDGRLVGEAFAISERAHARALLDLLADSGTPALAGLSPEIAAQEERLTRRLARAQRALNTEWSTWTPDTTTTKAALADVDSIAAALAALRERALATDPRAAACIGVGRALDLDTVRRHLAPPHGLFLEYFVGESRTALFVVSRDEARSITIPAGRDSLAALVRSFRAPFEAPGSGAFGAGTSATVDEAAARALFSLLLGPIRDRLQKDVRVVVVPDGPLHYLPFAALVSSDTTRYLVEDAVLSIAPSASVLSASAGVRREPAPRALLAFGNPKVDRPLPIPPAFLRSAHARRFGPLPFAEEEARAVALTLDGDLLVGTDAAEDKAKTEGPHYRVLHFAAHGILDDERPLFSGLVLSPGVAGVEDGFLQVHEVLRLPLRADLVVLSGCETGLGPLAGGEGVIGLPRAFLAAGARTLLVSLWAIEDKSTAALMKTFYEEVKRSRGDAAHALALAQRAVLAAGRGVGTHRAAGPLTWGAFEVIGVSRVPISGLPVPLPAIAADLAALAAGASLWVGRRRRASAARAGRRMRAE
jgi:CHAT domain-containing protein/tetratricopeptide (TPR) repeat protein